MNDHQKGADGKEIALEARAEKAARLFSPSAARNSHAIVAAWQDLMPSSATVLELGSGTGEHGVALTNAYDGLTWQPSDPDQASRHSISAWAAYTDHKRFAAPLALNACDPAWWSPLSSKDIIVSINMIHIAPFAAAQGLFEGASALLRSKGHLFLYGPFKRHGKTADSNLAFDQSLKSRDESWGVRDIDLELIPLAAQNGLKLQSTKEMPANNMCVVFEKD